MIATYDSHCYYCDEMIYEGDEIRRVDDEWIHAECADEHEPDDVENVAGELRSQLHGSGPDAT